ncbi:hypothetical protein ACFL08_03145 [Patescibacteria group bacterium]
MKNKLIIIRGKTGGGKTTLVNRVGDEFGFDKLIFDEDIKKRFSRSNWFSGAGAIVNEKLRCGRSIVVEEAFLDKENFDNFFEAIDDLEKYDIFCVRLECLQNTSIKRKTDLSVQVVAGQFTREVYIIDDLKEFIINTENKSKEEVLNEFIELGII